MSHLIQMCGLKFGGIGALIWWEVTSHRDAWIEIITQSLDRAVAS
jgi:hypothetical protein